MVNWYTKLNENVYVKFATYLNHSVSWGTDVYILIFSQVSDKCITCYGNKEENFLTSILDQGSQHWIFGINKKIWSLTGSHGR